MNTLFLYHLLLSAPLQGLIWTIILFIISFLGVYVAHLAHVGWEHQLMLKNHTSPTEKQDEEKKAPAKNPQEPIYYIVEKKKRRPKTDYGEPQPFEFKKN